VRQNNEKDVLVAAGWFSSSSWEFGTLGQHDGMKITHSWPLQAEK
jgi:hypothetical protein